MSQNVSVSSTDIGERVKALRNARGWTGARMGKLLHITGAAYNMKERGKRDFTWDEIILLSDIFDMTLDEMIRDVKSHNIREHRTTGLSSDAIDALKSYSERNSNRMPALSQALSSVYVLDALARYIGFKPAEKGYYLAETDITADEHFIECRMSQELYFSVLGQNLLHVLDDARNQKDESVRKHFEVLEDFQVEPDEPELKLAETSTFEGFSTQDDKTDRT